MLNLKINNIDISKPYTSILFSNYNYTNDIPEILKYKAIIIDDINKTNIENISMATLKEFDCTYLLETTNYTKIDEIKINILNNIFLDKDIYIFLNVLTYTDYSFKTKVLNYLKNTNKTIINYTTDIEEVLLLDYLIILHNNEVIIEGLTKQVLEEEKIIKKLGFNLPFIVELSIGLKYYGLIDKIYYDNESMVNELWN